MSDETPSQDRTESNPGRDANEPVYSSRDPAVTTDLCTVFDLLRMPRRRYLLYHLIDLDESGTTYDAAISAVQRFEAAGFEGNAVEATRVDVADDDGPLVADADEPEATLDGGTPSREAVRLDLCHVQLPRLESAGILEYDRRDEYIRFYGHSALEPWLTDARRAEFDAPE